MSEKNIVLNCIWRTDDFVVSDTKIRPSDDEAALIIDEKIEKITAQIPRHFSLVTKKIIERRVHSIAKSGFTIPKRQIRIGMGFEVEIIKDEVIPDVLLQEGHKYSLDRPTTVVETPTQIQEEKPEPEYVPSFLTHEPDYIPPSQIIEEKSEPEYVPTFLTQESPIPDTKAPIQPETKPDLYQEPLSAEVLKKAEEFVDDAESIAGRFIIALTRIGDVYITKKNDHYSLEYSAGRVDFRVSNGDIDILKTKRIPTDDQTLEQAISAATRK
ncbi:MAG: hypothetical protein ACFFB5_01600 [Promethearchaeota archaeon]